MKKNILLTAALFLATLNIFSQTNGKVRFLQVIETNDTSRVRIENDKTYSIKTSLSDENELVVDIYQDGELVKTYPEDTKIYAVEEDSIEGLPIMYINTFDENPDFCKFCIEPWRAAEYILFDGGKYLQKGLTKSGYLEIKLRGNTTANYPKRPFTIKLEDGHKKALAGMPKHRRWCLLANYLDPSLLRNSVAMEMGKIFDNMAWTPRSQPVEFYLNDEYVGVYDLVEQIKIDGDRVDIDEISNDNPDGGFIFELTGSTIDSIGGEKWFRTFYKRSDKIYTGYYEGKPENNDDKNFIGVNIKDPDGKDGELDYVFEDMKRNIFIAEAALYSNNFTDAQTGYRKYFDVASAVDGYLVNEIMKNPDTDHGSMYFYYEPVSKKYIFGPIWDFDLAIGNDVFGGDNSASGWKVKGEAYWLSQMMTDPYFVGQVKLRWAEKKAELQTLFDFIDRQTEYIKDAMARNKEKWGAGSENDIHRMREKLRERIEWIDGNIEGL
jgi:hypothetical protein